MPHAHGPSRLALRITLLLIGLSVVMARTVTAQDSAAPDASSSIVNDVIKHLDNKDDSIAPTPSEPAEPAPVNQSAIQSDNNMPPSLPAVTPATPAGGIPGIVAQGDNATLPQVPAPPPTYEDHKTVILRALDKVTARTQTLEVPVGQQFNFGALTIAVRACRARPPLEPADAAAFLQIVEEKPGEPLVARFSGWMFASKPSLSALEHPVYDVWVVGCKDNKS